MGEVIRTAIRDIRDRKFVETYVLIAVAAVVIALEIVSAVRHHEPLDAAAASVVIALLSALAYATIEIRRTLSSGIHGGRVWRFFANRNEIPQLEEQLSRCASQIDIFGLQLGYVVHNLLPALEHKATANCKIRLALLSPVDGKGAPIAWISDVGKVHCSPTLDEQIRANLKELRAWWNRLDAKAKKNVEIRAYSKMPTASVMFFDTAAKSGYAHVEPILYDFPPVERPVFWIREVDDTALFRNLVKRYSELWRDAIPLQNLKGLS